MTVKELREILNDVPDDVIVEIGYEYDGYAITTVVDKIETDNECLVLAEKYF